MMAQNGGGNNSGGTNPVVNPYGTNPYNPNQTSNPNFFDPDRKNGNGQNQNTNPSKDNTNNPPLQSQDHNSKNEFQDLNSKRSAAEEQRILETYQNDPDYLDYLKSLKQDQDIKIDTLNKSDSLRKSVYGANFFSNNVFDLSDKAPSAPPVDYRLGPGDEIIVSLWGGAELQQSYTLAKDGSIFPRLVGKIYLQGLNFEDASRIIRNQFKKIVPSTTNIDVQMGKPRTIRVTIVGEVKKQGTYTSEQVV